MNPKVDQYLVDGCMRCKYGGTPQCKVNNWKEELVLLRQIILACGLTEDLKWGVPCYTSDSKNIAMVSAFKDYASLSFFKGVLLKDPRKILLQQGKSSQSARLIKFTSPEQIMQQQEILKTYILEAVDIEKSEAKVEFKQNPEPVPDELLQKFEENASLKKAFYALTPGRQRGYIIYFSQPKKTETRFSRIEKCIPQIFNGKGMHDN
jgi:uncharacterized protein YdeI (YjbR/CyaY-like superfamily)